MFEGREGAVIENGLMSLATELVKRERGTVTGYEEGTGAVKVVNREEGGQSGSSDLTSKKAGQPSQL